MGTPLAVGSGIGALGFMKIGTESTWGSTYTYLLGPGTSITSGATSINVTNAGNIAAGMYVYFLDGQLSSLGGNNGEYPNLNEPPILVSAVAGTTITLATAVTQTHYCATSGSYPTSGARLRFGYLPTKGIYYESETLNATLGYWSPQLLANSRVGRQQILKGAEKVSGNIVCPLGPGWNQDFLVGSLGFETETSGTPLGTPVNTTSASASAVGATTISVTSATGITVGSYVQIDATPNREVRQVTAIATTTLTLGLTIGASNFSYPLRFAHASGVAVSVVQAPFTHTVAMANVLPSFAIEKFVAGDAQNGGSAIGTSFQTSFAYSGMYVGKAQLKVDNKTGPKLTLSMEGQGESLQPATSAASYPTTDPFTFYNTYLSINGTQVTNYSDIELSVDNKLTMDTFLNNSTRVGVIKPGLRMLDGKLSLYFNSYAQYNQFRNKTDQSLVIQFYQPETGYSTTITMPKVEFSKYTIKQPVSGLVMADVDFEVKLDTASGAEASMSVVDNYPINYGF